MKGAEGKDEKKQLLGRREIERSSSRREMMKKKIVVIDVEGKNEKNRLWTREERWSVR